MSKFFNNKPIERVEAGCFIFEWYFNEKNIKECYLLIKTVSGIWSMKLDARCHAYGYLLASSKKGNIDNIHGYAVMCYVMAEQITQEQALCDDIVKSILNWQDRKKNEAEQNANNTTQETLEADEAFMREVAEFSDATPKEQKKMREQWKEYVKKELDGDGGQDE